LKYDAVIFDFDYTLADATPAIVECTNRALSELGYSERGEEAIKKTVGMILEDMFKALTGVADSGKANRFRSLFRARADLIMADSTVLLPDAIRILSKLKEAGIKTGIVTTKYRYRIEQVLEKYGIACLIDNVIGFEDVENAKPDPEGLLKIIAILKDEKNNVLYVGDSHIDAETAANAVVDFAAITTGTTAREACERYPNVAVTEDLAGLMNFLDGGGI